MDFWSDLTKWQGDQRIALLEAISHTGSITRAAQQLHLSYKHAWDLLHGLSNLVGQELLISQSGGRQGGGSALTPQARELIHTYRLLESEHRSRLPQASGANAWTSLRWQTSARNHFIATVTDLQNSGLEVMVQVTPERSAAWQVAITYNSVQQLQLVPGKKVHVLCKASAIQLHPATPSTNAAAPPNAMPNFFKGIVLRIQRQEPLAEVSLQTGSPLFLHSLCHCTLLDSLGLSEGEIVYFSCDPHALLLGVLQEF